MLNGCQICYVLQKGKLNACPHCKKLLCKLCFPISSYDSKCSACIRSDLREEILSESIGQISILKREYNNLMDSSKATQLSLETLDDKCEELENSLLVREITHCEKIRYLDAKIDKVRRQSNRFSTIENLETLAQLTKTAQKRKAIKYQELLSSLQNVQNAFETEREKEKMALNTIADMSSLSSKCIPYTDLRDFICEKCMKNVRGKFREVLINGHIGRKSLMKSILDGEEKEVSLPSSLELETLTSVPGERNPKREMHDDCKCRII